MRFEELGLSGSYLVIPEPRRDERERGFQAGPSIVDHGID